MAKSKAPEFCVEDILADFGGMPDPRSHINQRHLLGDIIVICIMAVIAGADGPKAIGVWAKSNEDWLKQRLNLPNGVSSHDTIGRVLMTLNPAAFQSCFEHWILDMTFREDESRIRKDHGAENFGLLRRFVLQLLKQDTSTKHSMRKKRKLAGWDNSFLLNILQAIT